MSNNQYVQALTNVACNAHTPWLLHAGLRICRLSLAKVAWHMHAGNIRCRLADSLRPQFMLPSRCTHTKAYACTPWLMVHVIGLRRFPQWAHAMFVHAGLFCYRYPLTDIACQIRTSRVCACMPWLNLHVIGRCRVTDAHMPCQMRAGFGGCCLPLAVISTWMYVGCRWCWKATSDGDTQKCSVFWWCW